MPASPAARWAIGGALAVVLLAALSFGPIVRGRAVVVAAKRGFTLKVGKASPGFFAVTLKDLELAPEGVDGVRVTAPEVRVELGLFLRPKAVELHAAEVEAEGSPEALEAAMTAWRKRHPSTSDGTRPARALAVKGDGLALRWRDGDHGDAEVTGVSLSRDDAGFELSIEHARARAKSVLVEVSDANVALAGGTIKQARAQSAAIVWAPPVEAKGPKGATAAATTTAATAAAAATAPADPGAETGPLLALPDPHVLRARAAAAAAVLAARLEEEGSVRIDGLSFAFERAPGDRLSLGPGPWSVTKHGGAVDVEYTTAGAGAAPGGGKPAATPLLARVHLPTSLANEARFSLAGGPVALVYLGAKEGAAGVVDVDRATLTGKGDVSLTGGEAGDAALTFDLDVGVRGFGIRQPRIALETVHGLDLGVRARGVLDDDKGTRTLRLDDAEATFGALHLHGHGTLVETKDDTTGNLGFDVPTTSCQSLLDSIPAALIPTVEGAKMGGTLGGRGRLAFDSQHLDDLVLQYDIDDLCKMTMVPEPLAKERFQKPFMHKVYLPDGSIDEEETGPTTDAWTELDAVSPYMQVAVLTTEDGAFFHHSGFNRGAIKNSLIANLKARRFVRGASTITMQTAKNLFLSREKTLSRKLEELILTDYLEQNFTKNEIMELYLNVIEFGPDIYGVRRAADHYFGRKPEELTLAESLFLSSLLPRPLGYHKMYEKGEVPEGFMKTLHMLMQVAFKNGKISQAELTQGLAETIVFHKAEEPPPAKRAPVHGTRMLGEDEDWKPLD